MKWLMLATMLIPSMVYATPFLVCDLPPAEDIITHYEVVGVETPLIRVEPDPLKKYGFMLDLGPLPDKAYTLTVKACNLWGCSANAPFDFVKSVPSGPESLRVIPGP